MVPYFVKDPMLMAIAEEWQSRKHDLSQWVWQHLVNRTDIWGQYTGKPKSKYSALTMPRREKRGIDNLTEEHVTKHFASAKRSHLIGVHAQSKDSMSRWVAIDVDLHDSEACNAKQTAKNNLAVAQYWWELLQAGGHDPLLFDSNGRGGYHIWIIFAEPQPMADVYAFIQSVIADWSDRNLEQLPETFPKSAQLTEKGNGNWLRLPGLHHTHNHFTKVWSGDEWLDTPWLEGNEAINQILSTMPSRGLGLL